MTGKIKTLKEKGFGFITIDGAGPGEKDLFFHSNDLSGVSFNDLKAGDTVTFEVEQGEKGPKASKVSKE